MTRALFRFSHTHPYTLRIRCAAALAATLVATGPAAAQRAPAPEAPAVRRWTAAHEGDVVGMLRRLLEMPNLAADPAGLRANADTIRSWLAARGVDARLLDDAGGPPLVYGELRVPGARRTLLLYAHYDGQPVAPAQWIGTTPFHPVLRAGPLATSAAILPWPTSGSYPADWRIYARSASDDKAPIVAMLAALDALRAAGARPTMNLKFLFEGEEEAGSPHLEAALRQYQSLMRSDIAIVADGPVHPSGRPTVTFGARGMANGELTVYGATRPLHSGHYGNWAPNPAERLVALLAAMKDSTGRVLIPGWYDGLAPIGPLERAALDALAALPDNETERRELGVARPLGGGPTRWEMVLYPSLNVDGLRSAFTGREARTIIPDEATASLDFRLTAGMRPLDQLRRFADFVRAQGYFVVDTVPDLQTRLVHPRLARVQLSAGYPAVRTPLDDPAARGVVDALRGVAGDSLVIIPTMGGSVPGYVFPEIVGATYIGLPIVNPDNNQHAENENLRLGNLFEGVAIFAAVMRMR
jgi:acetylornithine deacetylase/succinyl-diaminopimelate desuccinylase-like protein